MCLCADMLLNLNNLNRGVSYTPQPIKCVRMIQLSQSMKDRRGIQFNPFMCAQCLLVNIEFLFAVQVQVHCPSAVIENGGDDRANDDLLSNLECRGEESER